MNIFQKLQAARVELQEMELKKSGQNTYSKYKYYELGDFLPAINKLCEKHGLFTSFNLNQKINDPMNADNMLAETASLIIYNSDEPKEQLVFSSPTAEVEIGKKKDGTGGAEPIQNLGGKITYMRRYMLMTAFEMVESDIVEQVTRQITNEVSEDDFKLINDAETQKQLEDVYKELKKKYSLKVILPEFKRRKIEIQQDSEEDQEGK